MNPKKVKREHVTTLTDLPNIGEAMERDLLLLGIKTPAQLLGRSAYEMYAELCRKTGVRQDPCVIDVFLSITHFMAGDEPKSWWEYTEERKRYLETTKV